MNDAIALDTFRPLAGKLLLRRVAPPKLPGPLVMTQSEIADELRLSQWAVVVAIGDKCEASDWKVGDVVLLSKRWGGYDIVANDTPHIVCDETLVGAVLEMETL